LSDVVLTSNDTAVAVWFEQAKQIENILQVLPNTTNIAVATGASQIERFWLRELRRAYQPFTNRVTFDWLNELSLEEMLTRVATLPPRSAIYYNHIHVDARGVPQENGRALSRLREVANAPSSASSIAISGMALSVVLFSPPNGSRVRVRPLPFESSAARLLAT
jgi:hypothetical protein